MFRAVAMVHFGASRGVTLSVVEGCQRSHVSTELVLSWSKVST
jgi:hypothetical protein